MRILVTGFDPFGGERVNPSIEAIQRLPQMIEGTYIYPLELPTVFGKCADVLQQAMEALHPDVVLCIGQAGGREALTPERVAINLDDARIMDNDGNQPIDQPIRVDGAPAYFSTLPIKAMVAAIQEAGLPAAVSNTAGTFVCNHIMYQVLYLTATAFPGVRAGFMHIPYMTAQVTDTPDVPSLSLEQLTKGIEVALRAIIVTDGQEDLHTVEGALH